MAVRPYISAPEDLTRLMEWLENKYPWSGTAFKAEVMPSHGKNVVLNSYTCFRTLLMFLQITEKHTKK